MVRMKNSKHTTKQPLQHNQQTGSETTDVLAGKFLQTKFYPVSNKEVTRLMQSNKFLLDRTGMQLKQLPDFDFSTDARSQNHSFSADYDMCEANVRFYASVGKDNTIDLHMFHTLKSGHDAFSISHYYLPQASVESAMFIARICSHGKNGQVHINWNGELMSPEKSHIHIVTKYYQQLELQKAGGNKEETTKRMAYADAVEIPKLENIAVCARFAQQFFNLAPSHLSLPMQAFATKSKEEFAKSIIALEQELLQRKQPASAPILPKITTEKKFDKSQKNRERQSV